MWVLFEAEDAPHLGSLNAVRTKRPWLSKPKFLGLSHNQTYTTNQAQVTHLTRYTWSALAHV